MTVPVAGSSAFTPAQSRCHCCGACQSSSMSLVTYRMRSCGAMLGFSAAIVCSGCRTRATDRAVPAPHQHPRNRRKLLKQRPYISCGRRVAGR